MAKKISLKFEEIKGWESKIFESGIDMQGQKLPHIGKSGNKKGANPSDLNISEEEFRVLKESVFDYYEDDFSTFGYEMN